MPTGPVETNIPPTPFLMPQQTPFDKFGKESIIAIETHYQQKTHE